MRNAQHLSVLLRTVDKNHTQMFVLQARYSSIDFDYFSYSKRKWARYHECKADVARRVAETFE